MKVLHFIPNLKDVAASNLLRYKLDLISNMSGRADVCVLTSGAGRMPLGNAEVRSCPSGLLPLPGRKGAVSRLLSSFCPDVVHIHACWSFAAYRLFRECARRRIPVVVTLDHGLERWHVLHHYWLSKLPKLLLFQREMLLRADALHVISRREHGSVAGFCWHPCIKSGRPWNDRIVEIEPFNLSGEVSVDGMVGSMLRLYAKVADSMPFARMTDDERAAEDELLMLGVNHGTAAAPVDENVSPRLAALDDKAWRRIFLHSADEGIYDYVRSGFVIAGIGSGIVEPGAVDRFSVRRPGRPARGSAGVDGPLVAKVKADKTLSGTELEVCLCFAGIFDKIRQGTVRRADFVRLYRAMRFNEYDEDLVEGKIAGIGLAKAAPRLLRIMAERYGLGEGFMFTQPSGANEAARLSVKLFKSDIQ